MIRNDILQTILIADTKSQTAILDEVSAVEIREFQWQGTEFSYPNIRLEIQSHSPDSDGCAYQNTSARYLVFTEDDSSQRADRIAGIIAQTYHKHNFEAAVNGVTYKLWAMRVAPNGLIPAIRIARNTWRSEAVLSLRVNQI